MDYLSRIGDGYSLPEEYRGSEVMEAEYPLEDESDRGYIKVETSNGEVIPWSDLPEKDFAIMDFYDSKEIKRRERKICKLSFRVEE